MISGLPFLPFLGFGGFHFGGGFHLGEMLGNLGRKGARGLPLEGGILGGPSSGVVCCGEGFQKRCHIRDNMGDETLPCELSPMGFFAHISHQTQLFLGLLCARLCPHCHPLD